MHPDLISIPSGVAGLGNLVLPSYPALLTFGFVLITIVGRRWARGHGLDPRLFVDFVIIMALLGVVGSRIMHVLVDGHFWDYVHVCTDPAKVDWKIDRAECATYKGVWDAGRQLCHPVQTNCLAFADVTAGGFAFYGGLIAAALYSTHFIRKHRWPAGKVVDMAGWTITFGLAWGRMGCFLASCCFGARTDSALGVVFPGGSGASREQWQEGLLSSYRLHSLPVHPTQLYEALGSLLVAAFAYFVLRPRKRFDGEVFCAAMIGYAAMRFLVEFLRRDERGELLGLSSSQIIALGFTVLCAWLWFRFRARAARMLG
jgi:phosphatidylglycerol---prolipoprotein diacylglyceryl transferase